MSRAALCVVWVMVVVITPWCGMALGKVEGGEGVAILGAECEPEWVEGFGGEGLGGDSVYAMAEFDDGSGPALYVGGKFTTAGGVTANNIARWNGSGWSPLGSGLSGLIDPQVNAMAVFDDGTGPALYVGGKFTVAGGVTVNRIAKWDGRNWSALQDASGGVVAGHIYALTVFDDGTGPALYVGGSILAAGGIATEIGVARWDGTTWSLLEDSDGDGVGEDTFKIVRALTVFDDGGGPALYAGGEFATLGGETVNNIARWDGTNWSALEGPSGAGVGGGFFLPSVNALAVFDDGDGPGLYVGGEFANAGGVGVSNIARWDGSNWSSLDSGEGFLGVSGEVLSLSAFDDGMGPSLYVGGDFFIAGSVWVSGVARWDGSVWSALAGASGGGVGDAVESLMVFDDGDGQALFIGGGFEVAGGIPTNRIARWDGLDWSALAWPGGSGMNGSVLALTTFDDGGGAALYAAGTFTTAGGALVDRIARWDGSAWSALVGPDGEGVNTTARALAVFDDGDGAALYVAGSFTTAGGVAANRIARWDGTAWSALEGPSGKGLINGQVYALAVFDDGTGPALYAAGNFTMVGGVPASNIARWDGADWSALEGPGGNGVDNVVSALMAFDDDAGPALYVGGQFTMAGSVAANRIARWDGAAWSALEDAGEVGVSGPVRALAVFDDGAGPGLYVGGQFTTAGGIEANGIVRWDGSLWSALAGPSGVGIGNLWVNALTVFDEGDGPALYAGGGFTKAGGLQANRIARWDGTAWSALEGPMGNGVGLGVNALAGFDDGAGAALYAGGSFSIAGGVASERIAKWRGCAIAPVPCAGDLNGDGVVDADDLGALLGAFGVSDAGDLNRDGSTDTDDLGILLGAFGNVCE